MAICVYDKIQCCFTQIQQIINILNEDYVEDADDDRKVPHITDREKYYFSDIHRVQQQYHPV
jgi:hypothetical protein